MEILPEARKFGGCYVFGIQSYAQLEDIYGEKAAATLFDVMNTCAFFRSGAEQLGLQGSVDKDVFTRLLEGRLPDGADLSRMQDGSNKHRPGYDLTFSAPKSVSMMAMLGGDKRLIDAHNRCGFCCPSGGGAGFHTGDDGRTVRNGADR
ncbi:hypothetical protein ECZU31_52910 [Escherichia coli]|nr:hypothetical protein ECZU31_52910 [Escherichia coli]